MILKNSIHNCILLHTFTVNKELVDKIYKKSKFTNWGATGEMYKNIEDKEFIGRKIDLNFQRLGLKQEVSWMRKKGSYVTSAESTFFYKCKKVKREHQLK